MLDTPSSPTSSCLPSIHRRLNGLAMRFWFASFAYAYSGCRSQSAINLSMKRDTLRESDKQLMVSWSFNCEKLPTQSKPMSWTFALTSRHQSIILTVGEFHLPCTKRARLPTAEAKVKQFTTNHVVCQPLSKPSTASSLSKFHGHCRAGSPSGQFGTHALPA